jgi:hypothetical protein
MAFGVIRLLERCRTYWPHAQLLHVFFPRRTTGYGFVSATFRLGGILGTVTFGNLVSASRAVPMLITAAVLLVGGIVSLRLPETYFVLL